ncbi:Carbon-nitrogen hydrolase [Rhypophila sp. PSN 637]
MSPTIKIALIQFQPKALSPNENYQYASAEIRNAASQGAHIAVLPEYHLTGWFPAEPGFIASCTESAAAGYLEKYRDLARDLNTHIVPGTIITPVSISGSSSPVTELHNIAHFIEASTGQIIHSYQKRNLWHPERGILTAATGPSPHAAFDVSVRISSSDGAHPEMIKIRTGMLICWDLAFPLATRSLVSQGAILVIIPSYWHISHAYTDLEHPAVQNINPLSEATFLNSVIVARAFENTAAMVLVNAMGESQVALPLLGQVPGSKLGIDEVGTRIVNVDLGILHVAEECYKLRLDMKNDAGGLEEGQAEGERYGTGFAE